METTTLKENASYTEEATKQNSGELHKVIEQYGGSPFDIVLVDGDYDASPEGNEKSFIKIGQFRVSDEMYQWEAKTMIDEKDWSLIMGAIGAVVRAQEIVKELNKKEN